MTYTDRYNAIIHYFQSHPVDKTKIYCKCHHILPRSCGGSNDKENLVNLPAAWHYRVHCYLPFVMQEQNNEVGYYKMLRAWKRCLNSSSEKIDLMKINEECLEYKILREAEANLQSVRSKNFHKNNPNFIKGNKNPMAGKHWWKDPNNKTKSLSIKDGDPVPEGWVRGHWHNDSQEMRQAARHIKGKLCITDGKENRYIDPNNEIPVGWHKGQTKIITEAVREAARKNIQAICANQCGDKNPVYGSIWINDGCVSKLLKHGKSIPQGWQKGRLPWIKK